MSANMRKISDGCWTNEDWQSGTPGAFAVIIGVSSYWHLKGGEKPAMETYNLSQLQVSAITAFAFFRWLADSYHVDGCPVAKVWLALSPTKKEIAKQPDLEGQLDGTFDQCCLAIGECREAMGTLSPEAGAKSRYFFFFSGHGLETFADNQILLPSDFLAPPLHSVNRSLRVRNLWLGLGNTPVSNRHFFIDACRSDTELLRKTRIEGTSILDDVADSVASPNRSDAVITSAPSGGRSFQPDDPSKGITIFGQALIDGLLARPDFTPSPPCDITILPLHEFLNRRMLELLASNHEFEYNEEDAPVTLGGSFRCKVLTSVGAPPSSEPVKELPKPRVLHYEELKPYSFTLGFFSSDSPDRMGWYSDQEASRLIKSIGLYNLSRRENASQDLILQGVRRARNINGYTYRLTLAFRNTSDHYWLQVDGFSGRWATVLPSDFSPVWPPKYEIMIDLQPSDPFGPLNIRRLEASLSQENMGFLGEAAHLWRKFRTGNAPTAALSLLNEKDHFLAVNVLSNKFDSPLAATVAAILLVKAEDYLLDSGDNFTRPQYWSWINNLAINFRYLPDGQVLWNEVATRRGDPDLEGLDSLAIGSLPFTGTTLAMLLSRSRELDRSKEKQAYLGERLGRVSPFVRTGGLFTTFYGRKDEITPDLFLNSEPKNEPQAQV